MGVLRLEPDNLGVAQFQELDQHVALELSILRQLPFDVNVGVAR